MILKKLVVISFCLFTVSIAFGQNINNIPPPLCGIKPGEEKNHVVQQGPKLFRGKLFNNLENIPVGEEHRWFLYLEDMESRPLEFAQVAADGINYEAGRGFATPPTVSAHIGNGHYMVQKVKFGVAGTWKMIFQVIKDGEIEIIAFDVEVD